MRRMSHHVSHYSLSLLKRERERIKINYFEYFETGNRESGSGITHFLCVFVFVCA